MIRKLSIATGLVFLFSFFMHQVSLDIPICFPRVLIQKDARLLRDLRILAYFKQFFSSDSNISTIKELVRALASHCPYDVRFVQILLVTCSDFESHLSATVKFLPCDLMV